MTIEQIIAKLGGVTRAAQIISYYHPTRTIKRWGVLRWQQSGKIPHWWKEAVDKALEDPHSAKIPTTNRRSIMYQDYSTKDLVAKREELADQVKAFGNAIDQIGEELIRRAGVDAQQIGTHNAEVDGFKVKVSVGKNVSWDQDALRDVYNRIVADDADPSEFIEMKMTVSETKYNAWPANWQAIFQPARTVNPTKPRVEVKP